MTRSPSNTGLIKLVSFREFQEVTDERGCAQMEEGTFELILYLCSSASIRGKIYSLRLRVSAVRILVEGDLCRYLWIYIRGSMR
jgi:hypothetical protein